MLGNAPGIQSAKRNEQWLPVGVVHFNGHVLVGADVRDRQVRHPSSQPYLARGLAAVEHNLRGPLLAAYFDQCRNQETADTLHTESNP